MSKFWHTYSDFTKFGIVIFVLISGMAGYALGFRVEQTFSSFHLLITLFGLYFLSSGSLALNQVQEAKADSLMKRTATRPIPSGVISRKWGLVLALTLLLIGFGMLFTASTAAGLAGVATVLLYNGLYTMWWKKRWVFAAVPGAIPGALPVVIGFAANDAYLMRAECVYPFLIMFLWQMPHFWTLAIKYKSDYADGHFPVLPVALGVEKTMLHIGSYLFVYLFLALASPWFVESGLLYPFLIVPLSLMVLLEFFRYLDSAEHKRWLPFFLWTNLSMLVFLTVPVLDRWKFLIFSDLL